MTLEIESPKVSVVMPVLNAGPYLHAAVTSIRGQTLEDFEFLVLDGGSTDGTLGYLEKVARQDARIRVIRSEGTFVDRLNLGIRLSRGQFVARMDADDISMRGRLARQADYLAKREGIEFVGAAVQHISPAGRKGRIWKPPRTVAKIRWFCLFENPLAHPVVMGRRDAFQKRPYLGERQLAEDFDLWSRVLRARMGVENLSSVLLKRRLGEGTMSSKNAERQHVLHKQIMAENILHFAKVDLTRADLDAIWAICAGPPTTEERVLSGFEVMTKIAKRCDRAEFDLNYARRYVLKKYARLARLAGWRSPTFTAKIVAGSARCLIDTSFFSN